jgi:predicted O-linked N-acetylglucosamine transferase (SPINDLY family)
MDTEVLEKIGKDTLESLKTQLGDLLKTQGELAAANLKEAGEQASTLGQKIIKKLSEVTLQMTNQEIYPEEGTRALESLWLAMENVQEGLETAAAVEAFSRGSALLASTQQIAFGVISSGISLAAPEVGRAISNGLKILTEKV